MPELALLKLANCCEVMLLKLAALGTAGIMPVARPDCGGVGGELRPPEGGAVPVTLPVAGGWRGVLLPERGPLSGPLCCPLAGPLTLKKAEVSARLWLRAWPRLAKECQLSEWCSAALLGLALVSSGASPPHMSLVRLLLRMAPAWRSREPAAADALICMPKKCMWPCRRACRSSMMGRHRRALGGRRGLLRACGGEEEGAARWLGWVGVEPADGCNMWYSAACRCAQA